MKRLAFFMSDLAIGGQQRALLDVLTVLDDPFLEVSLFTFSGGALQAEVPEYIRQTRLSLHPLLQHLPFGLLKHLFRDKRLKHEGSFDLAIDFSSYWNGCAAGVYHVDAAQRLVWIHSDLQMKRAREWRYKLAWLMSASKFKLYDQAVCVSKGAADALIAMGAMPSEKITVLPNLVDGQRLDLMAQKPAVLLPDPNRTNLVFLGRLVKVKQCALMLREFKEALVTRPDLFFYLIGDGPERPALEELVRREGLQNHVVFTGALENPYPLLSLMDALVLRSEYEGQGIVLYEARHFGLKLIISKNLEAYNPDLNGVDDLVAAMRSVGKKEVRAGAVGEDSRQDLLKTLLGIDFMNNMKKLEQDKA